MKRRDFIQAAIAASSTTVGTSAMSDTAQTNCVSTNCCPKLPFSTDPVAMVPLTDRICCSRIGLGSGVNGGNRQSNMTRMERKDAIRIFQLCYDAGIRLFDLADLYGTHDIFREALADKPRDSYTIITKIWEHPRSLPEDERPSADIVVKRFLKELDTDYLDLVQIHCLVNNEWVETYGHLFEPMARLKEQGLIRGHGVTCHALTSAQSAAVHPWVDALHIRINTGDTRMEGSWDENVAAATLARQNGKGVVAMKVLGEGSMQDPADRKRSTDAVTRLDCISAMVVGFEQPHHIPEFLNNVSETLQAMESAVIVVND